MIPSRWREGRRQFARHFPFLPRRAQRCVQLRAQGLQPGLEAFPDRVDLGIVGDALQRDVRHALVDEALAQAAMRGRGRGDLSRHLGLLALAFGAVSQQIPGIARAHDPRAGERQRDARGVHGDPAPPPLLGDIGGGARPTGGIEHEVARIGGHQDAAFDDFC